MRGKKTSTEIKAKIIEEKINNPDLSSRDIENKLWIPHETTAKVLREDFAQVCTESERIAKLIDSNNSLLSLTDLELNERLQGKDKDKIRPQELVSIKNIAFNQNQLLTWKATSNVNVIWDILKDIQWIEK